MVRSSTHKNLIRDVKKRLGCDKKLAKFYICSRVQKHIRVATPPALDLGRGSAGGSRPWEDQPGSRASSCRVEGGSEEENGAAEHGRSSQQGHS